MKIQKRLLLASLMAAIALLATSAASASAAVWKDKGVAVKSLVTLGLLGAENFEIAEAEEKKSGMNCEVKATMTTEGGSTAKITKWEIKTCKGFGVYASCSTVKKEALGLPWTVHVNAALNLTITNMRIKRTFSGCAAGELDKTITSTTVTLLSPSAIAEMEWKGSNGTYSSFGSFAVEAPNSGTYSVS